MKFTRVRLSIFNGKLLVLVSLDGCDQRLAGNYKGALVSDHALDATKSMLQNTSVSAII